MLKMQKKKKQQHKNPPKTKLVTEIGFNSEYSNIVVSVQYFVWSAFWILRDKLCYILEVSILTI